jgi:hypothetical protein
MAMETGFVDDVRTPENPYESPKPEGTPVEQAMDADLPEGRVGCLRVAAGWIQMLFGVWLLLGNAARDQLVGSPIFAVIGFSSVVTGAYVVTVDWLKTAIIVLFSVTMYVFLCLNL